MSAVGHAPGRFDIWREGEVDGPHAQIELTHSYSGPADLVYKIWTDPRFVELWWGLDGASITVRELDVRRGGRWRIDMRTPSGKIYRNEGVYLDVVENTRLVYSDLPDPDLSDWEGAPPGPRLHIVTFEQHGERTEVRLLVRLSSLDERDRLLALGMGRGLAQSLERLERILARLTHRT